MNWKRIPLSAADCARLDSVRWSAFTRAEAQALAEGWNAGLGAKELHAAFHRQIGRQSICILIGRLTQLGLTLRPARGAPLGPPIPAQPSPTAAPRQIPDAAHMARMRRLAPFDPSVAAALAKIEAAA